MRNRSCSVWTKEENDPQVLVGVQMNVSQQYAQLSKKANEVLVCIRNSVASRSSEAAISTYSALLRPNIEYSVQF